MRWIAATLLGAALAGAAPAARADEAHRLEVAREIVLTTHAVDNMRAAMPAMMAQMRDILVKSNPANAKDVDVIFERSAKRLDSQLESFADLAAKVYAREFSESDLDAMLAFDRTPAGQHVIEKQPEIGRAMMQVGQEWGQGIARDVIAEYQKEKAAAVQAPKL